MDRPPNKKVSTEEQYGSFGKIKLKPRFLLSLPGSCAAAVVISSASPAKAILTYYAYETGRNVKIETRGSLSLGASTGTADCGVNGAIRPALAVICTGPNETVPVYAITGGPTSFSSSSLQSLAASSVSGILVELFKPSNLFLISSSYVSGTPIVSSAIYNNSTLAGLGLTSTGTFGPYTLVDGGDTINVVVGQSPPAPAVPGPLPLLGAGVAFSYSRRLRRRINTKISGSVCS